MLQLFDSVPIMKCMLAKLNSKIGQKEKFATQSKCSKCCPSALTQACSRPCHSLMALSTTRCSRPDHVAIRCCIICYWAAFRLVLDYRKDFHFWQVTKDWDIVSWLTYNRVQNQLNWRTPDEVIVKVKKGDVFLKHSVDPAATSCLSRFCQYRRTSAKYFSAIAFSHWIKNSAYADKRFQLMVIQTPNFLASLWKLYATTEFVVCWAMTQ